MIIAEFGNWDSKFCFSFSSSVFLASIGVLWYPEPVMAKGTTVNHLDILEKIENVN